MHIIRRRRSGPGSGDAKEGLGPHPGGLSTSASPTLAARPLDTDLRNVVLSLATTLTDAADAARRGSTDLEQVSADALILVAREEGMSVGDLAARLGRSHSATVRLVERMCAAGLLSKEASPADARRLRLHVTPAGRAAAATAAEAEAAVVDTILADLTSGERVLLRRIAGGVAARLPGGVQGVRTCRRCGPGPCGAEGCPRDRLL